MSATHHPITEDDIANYLATTPDFFERHAELLASVELSSGHGGRAISLQERQAGMLRDKIKLLETRVVEMIRHSQDNLALAGKMQSWTRRLLRTADARDVPDAIVQGLTADFAIPQAALKVWDIAAVYSNEPFAMGVSSDVRTFAASLSAPYCGTNAGFEAAGWLADAQQVQSMALIALRASPEVPVTGLLVLASPDPQRFHGGMGTDFLERLGELAGTCLSRLHTSLPISVAAAND